MSQRGLLWRTVFRSPCVKWILPGSIGRHDHIDVAFVGESYVEFKEWDRASEILKSVAVVADFPAKIISAQMLGERKASNNIPNGQSSMELDVDENHAALGLPLQILVLVLDNASIVFLTMMQKQGQAKVCRSSLPVLSAGPLEQVGWLLATAPTRQAFALAAVDDNLTIFGLADTRNSQTTLDNLTRRSRTLPSSITMMCMEFINWPQEEVGQLCLVVCGQVENQVIFRAYVWGAEASLHPDNIQEFESKLLSDHGVPNMLIRLQRPGYFMLVCDRDIAVYHFSTDGNWTQTNTSPLYRPDSEDDKFRLSSQGVSPSVPRWTNWARPTRRPGWQNEVIYLAREDGCLRYVAMCLDKRKQLRISGTDDAGKLNSSIGSAFAILDVEQNRLEDGAVPNDVLLGTYAQGYPDIFLVAGDLSDGGIYEIGVRDGIEYLDRPYDSPEFTRAMAHTPQQRDRLINWAPVSAATLVTLHPKDSCTNGSNVHTPTCAPDARGTAYVACGRSPHASIAELRFGLEASTRDISLYADLEADLTGAQNMWVLHLDQRIPHILLSLPWKSVWLGLETENIDRLTGGLHRLPDCDLDQRTIAAAVLEADSSRHGDGADAFVRQERFIIQIMPSRVTVLALDRKSAIPQPMQHQDIDTSSVACIDAARHSILLANATAGRQTLVVHRLNICRDELLSDSKPLPIHFSATCALLFSRERFLEPSTKPAWSSLALVGDACGALHVLEVSSDLQLCLMGRLGSSEMEHDSHGEGVESVSVIESCRQADCLEVLTGHRSGRLSIYRIKVTSQAHAVEQQSQISLCLGSQPVHLLEGGISNSSILARCGAAIYDLDFSIAGDKTPRITNVYFTDPNDPTYQHGSLDTLCSVQGAPRSRLKDRLIGLESSTFLCGLVDLVPKPLPVRRAIPGTPNIIEYLDKMDMLIAGTTVNYVDEDACKRYAISELLCMPSPKAHLPAIKLEDDVSDMLRFQYPPGEKLHCVAQQPLDEDRCVIVAGSSVRYEVETDRGIQYGERGQLRWFNIRERHGIPTVECVKESKEPMPVQAICDTEDGAFLYAAGNSLLRRRWDASEKYWPKEALGAPFSSPIVAIRQVQSHLAYITTSHHSTSVIAFRGGFQRLAVHNDAVDGLCNLPVLKKSRTPQALTSSRDGLVFGLKIPSSDDYDDDDHANFASNGGNGISATSIFEAQLPVSINNLIHADIRPPYKRNLETPPGVLEDNILGTALDGSLFAFTILDDNGWRLLRCVQNLCIHDTRICPLESRQRRQRTPVEPWSDRPSDLSVEGDILVRLLDRGDAAEVLVQMLVAEPRPMSQGRRIDFNTVKERQQRFVTLVAAVIDVPDDDDDDVRLAVCKSLQYMRRVLDTPF